MAQLIDDHIIYQNKVINNIKNNKITVLSLTCAPHRQHYHEIDIYKQILVALKTNTSVSTLSINVDYTKSYVRAKEYDEWCGILSDVLKFNTTILTMALYIVNTTKNGLKSIYEGLSENKSIHVIKIDMSNDLGTKVFSNNNKMLENMLKTNTHLTHIHFYFNNIDSMTWSKIVESLKVNETVTRLGLTIRRRTNFNGSIQLKELLRVNKQICNMELYTRGMITFNDIISAIKNSPYITYFIENSEDNVADDMVEKIDKYCNRNLYNNKLKTMMLQDF